MKLDRIQTAVGAFTATEGALISTLGVHQAATGTPFETCAIVPVDLICEPSEQLLAITPPIEQVAIGGVVAALGTSLVLRGRGNTETNNHQLIYLHGLIREAKNKFKPNKQ